MKEILMRHDEDGNATGLVALRKCNVFMVTATIHDYWRKCLAACFNVPKDEYFVVAKSFLSVFKNDDNAFNIRGQVFGRVSDIF